MEETLQWSKVELLTEVYNDFDFNGLYLHLLCLNGFNRIIYVGEGNVSHRQKVYKEAYYKTNYDEFSCMDISKITGDPYATYTNYFDNDNSTDKLKQSGIYYEVNDVATEGIDIADIRRKYFESLYVTVAKWEDKSQIEQIERNLQKYFIDNWGVLNYKNGNLIGLPKRLKNKIDNNLVIYNFYDDTRLSNLPSIILFKNI